MSNWIQVAKVSDITPGSGKEVMAGPNIVALFHVGDRFFALDGICPHAGGPLGEGALTGEVVTCPWHGWQFNVTTGHHCLNPRIQHRTFPVEVRGDEIFIDIAE